MSFDVSSERVFGHARRNGSFRMSILSNRRRSQGWTQNERTCSLSTRFDEPPLPEMNERYIKWWTPYLSREFEMLAVSGASLGAYHAANIAFRHPDLVSHLISLSGSFDISSFFDGYHDDNIYFNSPYEYLPNTTDPWKYNHMGIILGTGEWDNTRHESLRLSEILNSKGIKHFLDDRRWCGHEWSYWRDMLPYYLSLM